MKRRTLALTGLTSALALAAFLSGAPALAQDHVDAGGMPTDHSTPAEQAQTSDLNAQVSGANAAADMQAGAADAQYQTQQQQYQNQLQQNQAAQQDYQDKSATYAEQAMRYQNLRTRYAAERAAYHRGAWPERYSHWTLDESGPDLVGQRVEILDGARVGTVKEIARGPNGHVEALFVQLDNDKQVWIDQADIRYDRGDRIVMTNLDRTDLHQMADERL